MTNGLSTETTGKNGRSAKGQFVVGNPGGPGGRPGAIAKKIDIVKLARRKCKELDLDLETLLWDVIHALLLCAAAGNTKAAAIVLDRFGGVLERTPLVAIDARGGPPIPGLTSLDPENVPTLGQHLAKLAEIAHERGVIYGGNIKPVDIVVKIADAQAAEIEELLS